MLGFNDFKAKVNEIISIIDKPVAVIDKQVKEYEEKQKQEKRAKIQDFFNKCNFHDFKFEQIFEEKWLNASVSMKSIEESICAKGEQISMDMKILADLPEYSFEATEVYKTTLDVRTALNEANRLAEMAKRKAEQERIAAEAEAKRQEEQLAGQMGFSDPSSFEEYMEESKAEPSEEVSEDCDNFIPDFAEEPARKWSVLKVNLTPADETALLRFLEERSIEFSVL